MAIVIDPSVKEVSSIIVLSADTNANWLASDPVIPANVLVVDTTDSTMKLGDNVKKFSELPVKIDQTFTTAHKVALDKIMSGTDAFQGKVNYFATYAQFKLATDVTNRPDTAGTEQDAWDEKLLGIKKGMIVIINADNSTGANTDFEVAGGAFILGWDEAGNTFIKLGEIESLDIDLTPYFNMTTNTLDDVTAGITNVHFTATEKTKLGTVEEGADVTDVTNVAAAGAVMFTDKVLIRGMNAAELAAVITVE